MITFVLAVGLAAQLAQLSSFICHESIQVSVDGKLDNSLEFDVEFYNGEERKSRIMTEDIGIAFATNAPAVGEFGVFLSDFVIRHHGATHSKIPASEKSWLVSGNPVEYQESGEVKTIDGVEHVSRISRHALNPRFDIAHIEEVVFYEDFQGKTLPKSAHIYTTFKRGYSAKRQEVSIQFSNYRQLVVESKLVESGQ